MSTQPMTEPLPAGVFNRRLKAVNGTKPTLASLAGRLGTVVIFAGNGCPTVRAYEERLKALRENWGPQDIELVVINANNPHLSPPDTFGEMIKRARERDYNFPYLKDADGAVARCFGAVCTPHAFLLSPNHEILYRGRIDNSRLGTTIESHDLEDAIRDVVAGRAVMVERTEPFGCSIVW